MCFTLPSQTCTISSLQESNLLPTPLCSSTVTTVSSMLYLTKKYKRSRRVSLKRSKRPCKWRRSKKKRGVLRRWRVKRKRRPKLRSRPVSLKKWSWLSTERVLAWSSNEKEPTFPCKSDSLQSTQDKDKNSKKQKRISQETSQWREAAMWSQWKEKDPASWGSKSSRAKKWSSKMKA